MNLLSRLLAAVLWLPLALSKPFLAIGARRRRRSGAWRLRPPQRARTGARDRAHERARARQRKANAEPEVRSHGHDSAVRAPCVPDAELMAMRDALTRALGAEPTHRHSFRYLARFERKLAERGLRAMEEVPLKELRRALRDFEALVRNWSEPGLANLRSRMAVTLTDRSSAASVWITANSVASAMHPEDEALLQASRFPGAVAGAEWQSSSAPA